MSDLELYVQYFPVGKKVGVGIPLPDSDVFKDWAIVHEIDEDLISMQLSRDELPENVLLHYGQILELRVGNDNSGYSCRAIVVSEGEERQLLLRLIGEIVSDELREFYRIDAFLPIKYFVSHEQHIDQLHKQWDERRSRRQQLELDRKSRHWDNKILPLDAELPHERHPRSNEIINEENDDHVEQNLTEENEKESWNTIIPLAANISGGGLRIVTHQGFENGEYILLEILVPSPHRVVDTIGRVVFANRNFAADTEHEYFNTGVQFVYIDERDRDAIVNYISTIQLKRIRQLRERYLYRGALEVDELFDTSKRRNFKRKLFRRTALLLFVVLVVSLVKYFWWYAHERPKGEIERTFENEIRIYRGQQKQN
jgi:c-di-GMP-binding flagellar brake protein YcgR